MIFLGRFLLAAFRQGTFSLAVLVYLVCIWYSRSSFTLASFPLHWFIFLCGEIHCFQGYLGTAVPFCGPDFQCILRANLRINLSWCGHGGFPGWFFQSLRFQPFWMCSQGGVKIWWPFVQKLGVKATLRGILCLGMGDFPSGFLLFHTLFVDFLKCQLWWKNSSQVPCVAPTVPSGCVYVWDLRIRVWNGLDLETTISGSSNLYPIL